MLRFLEAVFVLSGMIIGVGMFAIPFSFAQAGFWFGIVELAILAGVVLVLHVFYGEIVLATPRPHRLPGYIREYLGGGAALVSWGSAVFGIVGALLAYVVAGSLFLGGIFSSLSGLQQGEVVWAFIFAAAGAAVTLFPLRSAALVNGVLTAILIIFLFLLSISLLPQIQARHLGGVSVADLFLPYGVLLFALSGGTVIPDVVSVVGRRPRIARLAIVTGSLIPVLLYGLFALAVVGVSGAGTSVEAISGLGQVIGSSTIVIGSIVGVLAVFTSYLVLASSFRSLLEYDLRLPGLVAWAGVHVVPFLIYLLGFHNFIRIIRVVGIVSVGIDAALVVTAYMRMRHLHGRPRSRLLMILGGAVWIMVAAGIGYELFHAIGRG